MKVSPSSMQRNTTTILRHVHPYLLCRGIRPKSLLLEQIAAQLPPLILRSFYERDAWDEFLNPSFEQIGPCLKWFKLSMSRCRPNISLKTCCTNSFRSPLMCTEEIIGTHCTQNIIDRFKIKDMDNYLRFCLSLFLGSYWMSTWSPIHDAWLVLIA